MRQVRDAHNDDGDDDDDDQQNTSVLILMRRVVGIGMTLRDMNCALGSAAAAVSGISVQRTEWCAKAGVVTRICLGFTETPPYRQNMFKCVVCG